MATGISHLSDDSQSKVWLCMCSLEKIYLFRQDLLSGSVIFENEGYQQCFIQNAFTHQLFSIPECDENPFIFLYLATAVIL